MWKVPSSVKSIPCLHRLQKGSDMGITCTLMGTMLDYINISANLILGKEQLYGKAISEVQVNGITKE